MSVTFTKLFSSITESTLWCEPHATRIAWITMLAMCDRRGRVFASVPGLANRARITVDEARAAIAAFLRPDPDSRTQDHEGRRIEPIDGGWRLLNYDRYRAIRDAEQDRETARERVRRYRERRANVTPVTPGNDNAEAEAEAEAETATATATATEKTHSAAPRPERSPRGSRLPPDWTPDATLTAWTTATRPDLDQTAVLAEFRDYWAAIPGTRGAKLDWPATWRNWIRRTGAAKRPGTPYDPIATAHEAMRIMAARAAADADRGPTP